MTIAASSRTAFAMFAGRTARFVSRQVARRDGSVIGGRLALCFDPRLVERWAADRRVAVVSGTNGKTTTAALLAAGLAPSTSVASNADGANLPAGIATAVMTAAKASTGVFELDEAYLAWGIGALDPDVVVLLNLSRDQLDRLHEVHATAARWRDALARCSSRPRVIANADDPLVVWAVGDAAAVWVAAGLPWRLDAAACPHCRGTISYTASGWRCRDCTLSRPPVDAELTGDVLRTSSGTHRLPIALPGRCNRANAAMALAAATAMGVDPRTAVSTWPAIDHIGPRFATTSSRGSSVRLLLAKNPAGWREVLDMLDDGRRGVVLVLNARTEDGGDPSWIWDVAFERLAGRPIVCSGERAADLSVRLTYAGIQHCMRPGPIPVEALAGDVDVVANYSAFRRVARQLARAS